MKTAKKALTVIVSVVLWIIILVAALFAFTTLATRDAGNVASIAGYTPLSVMTESMSPTFQAGDLILIRHCDPATLQVGDIITFHTIIENEYALNTHRIEEINMEYGLRSYVTKGDNNAIVDTSIIGDSDIVGKYVGRLPGFGKVIDLLSSPVGFLIVIVLPMLLFFIYQVYHIIMVSISLKRAIATETAQLSGAATDADAQLAEAQRAREEAEAQLAEARRLKEEAERLTAQTAENVAPSVFQDLDDPEA